MSRPYEAFLGDLDARWAGPRLELRVVGSTALFLQTPYNRGTKDSDVLQVGEIDAHAAALEVLGGKGSPLHVKHAVYLDLVGRGLLFMSREAVWHRAELRLAHFDVVVLDVVDVVVSKLIRFHSDDRADIDAMVTGGHVPHERFLAQFLGAMDAFVYDGRSDRLPGIIYNLHRVERDSFGLPETRIRVPDDADR